MPNASITPLLNETRVVVPTCTAAHHFCLSPRTLRKMADESRAPVQPVRVGKKLLWPTAAIRTALGV